MYVNSCCKHEMQEKHLSANKLKYPSYPVEDDEARSCVGPSPLSKSSSSLLHNMKNNIIIGVLTGGYIIFFVLLFDGKFLCQWIFNDSILQIFLQFKSPAHICVGSRNSLWNQAPVQVQTRSKEEGSRVHHSISSERRTSPGMHPEIQTPQPVFGEGPHLRPSVSHQVTTDKFSKCRYFLLPLHV